MKTTSVSQNVSKAFILILCLFTTACLTVTGPVGGSIADLESTIAIQSTQIAHLSTLVARDELVDDSQWEAISYLSTQMPLAIGLIKPIPRSVTITLTPSIHQEQIEYATDTPTPTPNIDIEYPPDTRTGIQEIDVVIDAILEQDVNARIKLVSYITQPCTTADGLGGPPKCEPGETDGTMVEAFPVSNGEGHHIRLHNVGTTFDFTVRGLYAVYVVSEDAYHADYWPAGEYGIVFTSEEGGYPHMVTVFVEVGRIVRLNFGYGWPPFDMVREASDEFLLSPMR